MSRTKKIFRNIVIIGILFFMFLKISGLYLSPLSAYRNSERRAHYGPSEIIHIEDSDKDKLILAKYDKWISSTTIYRNLFFFWRSGPIDIAPAVDPSHGITYTWTAYDGDFMIFGIVNDKDIVKVQLVLENGEAFSQSDFYDEDMFILKSKTYEGAMALKGYDKDNNIIFEKPL